MAHSASIAKVSAHHKQLALYMIAHPGAKLSELSKHFSKTPAWISIIRNSDAFKVYYQTLVERQLDTLDPILQNTQSMTDLALEKINNKLSDIGDQLSITELKEVADMGLKRLGYGANIGAKAPTTVNIHGQGMVVVDRGELESARQRIAEAHGVGSSPKQLAAPALTPVLPSQKGADE